MLTELKLAELVQYHMYDVASMTIGTYTDRNLFLLAEPFI